METTNDAVSELMTEDDHYTENTNLKDKTVDSEGLDEFYFESDHLALKGNKDYLNLLKTIAILESQRIKAIKDVDELLALQERALQDPMKFVEQLQQGEDLGMPARQIIAEIPNIDWSAYNITLPPEINRSRKTMQDTMTESNESKSKVMVRGRVFDDSKPETFNQLWTAEEQRRLEELLIEYPPEEVETRRWQKIAAALGNRTTKQVCSRVQKYFIKLHKAGLPVPGRIPKMQTQDVLKRGYLGHRHQRHNHFLFRQTTFFPSQDVPVYMSEFDDDAQATYPATSACELETKLEDDAMSEDEAIPEKYHSTAEYRQLCLLRRVRREKDREKKHIQHTGYKCDVCKQEPITGTRWHCIDCPPNISVDFCTDCVITQMESSNPHPWSHRLVDVRKTGDVGQGLWDEDYGPQSFSGRRENYNYLDPNFMPE